MKKITILLALAFAFQIGFAQEETTEEVKKKPKSDVETVFSKTNWKVTGGFFGPEAKVTTIGDDYVLNLGARLGMTINKKFALGLAGYGQLTEASFDHVNWTGGPLKVRSGYGGLYGEYVLFTNKAIHFTIPVMVGLGYYSIYEEVDYISSYWNDWEWNDWDEIENSTAFVLEPGVNMEINLTKFMRFHLGASYKLVSGTNLKYLSNEDLTDFTFTAGIKFGFF